MSSPRVLRTVVTMPASLSALAKAVTAAFEDRSSPEAGKGLNGIRFSFHQGLPWWLYLRTRSINCWACSGWSLTPSSMQYSKVMKSRGANSR